MTERRTIEVHIVMDEKLVNLLMEVSKAA